MFRPLLNFQIFIYPSVIVNRGISGTQAITCMILFYYEKNVSKNFNQILLLKSLKYVSKFPIENINSFCRTICKVVQVDENTMTSFATYLINACLTFYYLKLLR